MSTIFYDGIGANKNGIHTENEFLRIMKNNFTDKKWSPDFRQWREQLDFKDWALPDDFLFFTLSDWLEYSGACIS